MTWKSLFFASLLGLCLVSLISFATQAQPIEIHDSGFRTFPADQTGQIRYLGIEVDITPDLGAAKILGFLVDVAYQDPIHRTAERIQLLGPTLIPTTCTSGTPFQSRDPVLWHNDRGVSIAITFVQHCKDTTSGPIPFLETQIWLSEPEQELARIDALATGRVFDLWPVGRTTLQESAFGKVLRVGKEIVHLTFTVLTVIDVIAFSHGAITAGRFAVRLVVGYAADQLTGAGFDYAIREHSMEAVWEHEGWRIRCRICGEVFFREDLRDGERLVCPRQSCQADAILHFDHR